MPVGKLLPLLLGAGTADGKTAFSSVSTRIFRFFFGFYHFPVTFYLHFDEELPFLGGGEVGGVEGVEEVVEK